MTGRFLVLPFLPITMDSSLERRMNDELADGQLSLFEVCCSFTPGASMSLGHI